MNKNRKYLRTYDKWVSNSLIFFSITMPIPIKNYKRQNKTNPGYKAYQQLTYSGRTDIFSTGSGVLG